MTTLCIICGTMFETKEYFIRKGQGKYCSRACHYRGAMKGRFLKCHICGNELYRSPSKSLNSKSGKFFCSKSCQTVWRNKEYSGNKHKQWKDGVSTYRDIMLKSNLKKFCRLCHIKDLRILVVHHKDENRKNYDLDNLVWLCHNCHHRVHKGLAKLALM